MNKVQKSVIGLSLACLLSLGMANQLHAAQNQAVELVADTIEYDSVHGIMKANGGVQITQEGATLSGANVEYNTKTREAYMTGGVKAVQADTTLTSAEIRSYENTHLVASGDAVLTKGENCLTGANIEYYSDKEYAMVPAGGRITMPDGVMEANQIEAFLKENRAVGTGSVHIVSEARKLDATSDQAVYYGAKNEQNRVVLSGNARAVQDGNVLTGNTLTIRLDDKTMDAKGRTKLIIKPQ